MEHSGFKVPSNWRVLDWVARAFFLGPGSSGLLDLVQGYLHTRSIGSGTYCLSLVHSILPMDLVHSSRWTRTLFYTSLELPIWADHIPAYLGNSFRCVQYRMCYTCPGPIFQCEFNCDVHLVIRLTKFGNFGNWYICICIQHRFSMWIQLWCQFGDWTNQIWQFRELVHMYMHSALIFNVDPAVMSIQWLD